MPSRWHMITSILINGRPHHRPTQMPTDPTMTHRHRRSCHNTTRPWPHHGVTRHDLVARGSEMAGSYVRWRHRTRIVARHAHAERCVVCWFFFLCNGECRFSLSRKFSLGIFDCGFWSWKFENGLFYFGLVLFIYFFRKINFR